MNLHEIDLFGFMLEINNEPPIKAAVTFPSVLHVYNMCNKTSVFLKGIKVVNVHVGPVDKNI